MIKPKDCVSKVAKISRIKKVQKTDYSRCSPKKLKILEQELQQKAILTNNWYYYAELQEIRKVRMEVGGAMEKWVNENFLKNYVTDNDSK